MSTAPIQQDYHYQVDQQVSVNAFFEADVEGETVKFQVTSRYGSTPEKIVKTTEAAIEAYKILRAAYPMPSHGIDFAKLNRERAEATGEKKFEQKPAAAPEGLPEGEYFTDEFDYFIVEPQPDDKATVKFYKDNLKYPVGANINKWKNERVTQAIGSLVEGFDPAKANKYRVAGKQYWTKGNSYVNDKGEQKNYKDFRAAELTF
jgi:hypothetical protein